MTFKGRSAVAWIAAIAVMLQALWPLVSHARPQDPTHLVPLCTVEGVTHYLELKAGKSPSELERRTASHGEHCKLCVLGEDRAVALPHPVVPALHVSSFEAPRPAVDFPALESLPHFPAQPRAPPVLP